MDIILTEEELRKGILAKFNKVWPGALEVFMVLMAYAPEKTRVARITIKTIMNETGFSLVKAIKALNRLKEVEFIEAPFEGQQGKKQIYKLKILMEKQSLETKRRQQQHRTRIKEGRKCVYIYFILDKNQDAVKIGVSYDPKKRFKYFQRELYGELELLGYTYFGDGARKAERELHKVLKNSRIKGEWFRNDLNVKAVIESIIKGKERQEQKISI